MRAIAGIAIATLLACGSETRLSPDGSIDPPDSGLIGEFGAPCTMHTDCTSGYCVEPVGGAGGVCSRVCDGDCPTGYDCLPVEFPTTEVQLCVPSTVRQCATCATDDECPGGVCLTIDGQGACGATCNDNAQCPIGYTCDVDDTGTHAGTFCQPVTRSCSCSPAMAGAQRSCSTTNAIGTCLGTQTCDGVAGWSVCTALIAAVETCDGVDNDCNFVIDNGVGGGEACTNTVTGVGSCPGIRTCAGAQGFKCTGQTPTVETCNTIDDNCNGTTDEGFAGLGNSCSAGVGACLQFGSIRCNGSGTGTECSAVAGPPAAERCNQIDDNCNGSTDETFTTLGTQCTAGQGVCTRFGSFVCDGVGTGVACSATPGAPQGTDVCNFLDDDCDGGVDEAFKDPVTGFYNSNTNCGTCGNDCTSVFDGPNASGVCAISVSPLCEMVCDPNTGDLNNSTVDGCEFVLDAGAVYVSINDATGVDDSTCGIGPAGTGAGHHPCKSIAQGLARSTSLNRPRVLVADGTYDEAVTLITGKNLLGGFRADTWERHLATTSTVIQGVSATGNHDRTVIAINITTATLVEGFVIRGSANTKASGNSYAVYIAGSNANLALRDNQIFGGRGGPGAVGGSGTNGSGGTNGGPYTANAFDAFTATGAGDCAAANNRGAFGGGAKTCGGDDVSGGNGGGNNCTPVRSTQTSTSTAPATVGQAGAGAGGGAAGTVGSRGFDATQLNFTGGGSQCALPIQGNQTLSMDGTAGAIGGDGANGPGVAGCAAPSNLVVGGHWVGTAAPVGVVGLNGGGGGGGGAGAGANVLNNCSGQFCMATGKSELGAHGGGGGSGGCGGNGGGAGGVGGAAFGIFITGGVAPTLISNAIGGGIAGDGGAGGIGGVGGLGGAGSQGGEIGTHFCTGKGGRGGDGGDGGRGGGGGGGCGGSSFGVFTQGVGTPAYCGSNTVTSGAAGGGGSGGFSAGNSGGAGAAGTATACTSI
jgi:hypothetical protein